jgi:hypothetical protein
MSFFLAVEVTMWKMAGTVMGPASRARREAARAAGEPWDVLLWRD